MIVYARLFLAHLPAFLLGLGLVEMLWPHRLPRDAALKLALAPLLGWGVSSCLYFLWCLLLGPAQAGFNLLEGGLALAILLAGLSRLRHKPGTQREGSRITALRAREWWGAAAALLVFCALAGLLWLRASAQPGGNFDAYAIWNLRARFLFLTRAADWRASFSPAFAWWTHADYPLLWPLTLLRGYLSQGRILSQAGVFQALVFALALGGLFMAGLARLRGFWQAALGGLLLLGLPWFIDFSAFQQADVPLAAYYLACVLLMLLAQSEGGLGLWALAGLAAGCAAWTKNDGLVFLIAAWIAAGMDAARARRVGGLGAFVAGLGLPLAAVLVFKLRLAPPGDLIGAQTPAELLASLLDPSRYLTILSAILRQLATLGGLLWPALLALAALLLLAGLAPRRPALGRFLPLGLTLLGYCAIYLITPHPLAWHLGYSLDRLVFHLLIPTLFLLLARARSPEEIVSVLFTGKAGEQHT